MSQFVASRDRVYDWSCNSKTVAADIMYGWNAGEEVGLWPSTNSRAGWAPCCHVKQRCCLLSLQIQTLFISPSTPSDQWWCVVCSRGILDLLWESLRTRWESRSRGISEAWKYIGYENINQFLYRFLNCNPSGYRLTHQNWWITAGERELWHPHKSQTIQLAAWRPESTFYTLATLTHSLFT